MTVRGLALLPFAIPLRTPLDTAHGPLRERRGVIVRLEADGGLTGLGEATPHPSAPPAVLALVRSALTEARCWIVGASLDRLDALAAQAGRLPSAAACGLDTALHDLAARAAGRPLVELLGGAGAVVPASALLEGATPAATAAAAAAAARAGYRAAKLKVGRDVEAAVACAAAARAAAPALGLRLDVNRAWGLDAARTACGRLAGCGVEWVEEPLAAPSAAALAALRRETGVPIAADESVTGPDAVAALVGADAVDAVVLKLVQVGGLKPALATARAAVAAGLALTVTTSFDTAVGTAAALHLAAALADRVRPCGVATTTLLAGDLTRERIVPGPIMTAPAGPGLGVTLEPGALARWRPAEEA